MFFFSTKIPYVNAVWLVKKKFLKIVTWDQADRIHWCSMMGGHLLTRHPRTFTRRGLCWQKLSDRITQPFSVLLRQDTSRVFTPLPHVWEHWKNIFHTCSVNSFNFRNISLDVVSFICTFYWGFKVIVQKQLLLNIDTENYFQFMSKILSLSKIWKFKPGVFSHSTMHSEDTVTSINLIIIPR